MSSSSSNCRHRRHHKRHCKRNRHFEKVTAETICAQEITAKKKLDVPEKCKKATDYVTKDYRQYGENNRFVGAWEFSVDAPAIAGGTRRIVVAWNLGGTVTFTSTILAVNPAINQRNMYQGEWYITNEDDSTATTSGIASVYLYNSLGQVLGYQALKYEGTLTKDPVNPLNDTGVGDAVAQSYNFVFATPGDPTTSIVGQVPVGPVIPLPFTAKRLSATDQFLALKTYFNDCNTCVQCDKCDNC
jgi:hypothetical protein